MTAEKEPKCIKCKEEKHLEFDIGWEKIIDNSDCINNPEGSARIFWLCPKCIREMEAVRMLYQDLRHGLEEAGKVWRLLADLKYLLDRADEIDSPKYDYKAKNQQSNS